MIAAVPHPTAAELPGCPNRDPYNLASQSKLRRTRPARSAETGPPPGQAAAQPKHDGRMPGRLDNLTPFLGKSWGDLTPAENVV